MKQPTILLLAFILISCSSEPMTVEDVTISIKPYDEADRGKMWKFCINSKNRSRDPFMFLTITYANGHRFDCTLKYDWGSCKTMNVLVYLTHRHTPHSEWEYLHDSDVGDIDNILVRVKEDYDDPGYIFERKIKPKLLSN